MHSKVPNEILIKIFQRLHPIDQLECMLVCHRWNQLIEDCTLYHTVFIYSPESLKKLLQKIQQRPDIANRIERLFLWFLEKEEEGEETTPSSKLLSLVPNLKVLRHCVSTVLRNQTQYSWYNQIEYISEDTPVEMADDVLSSDTYPNLKTLSYCSNECVDYYPIFNNASALTSLTLEEVNMGFDDIEAIHRHVHHLKSLKLSTLYYLGDSLFSGKEITPATSVTEFVADVNCDAYDDYNLSCLEMHEDLLLYASRKYPNLSTFKYEYCGLDKLDHNQVIATGLNPLLQRLGPQLKKVSIWFPDETDYLIDKFDEFGCQINDLTLYRGNNSSLKKLAQTTQGFYLQTLLLTMIFPSFDWLKNFRVLKKLDLCHCESHKIHLSDILDNCPPTLESLSLHVRYFDIDPNYTGTSNIKTLTFRDMNFDDKIDRFISRCFPQLSSLELHNCKLQNDRLNLEKTDLVNFYYRFCEYWSYYITDYHPISVTTLKDNKRRSYALYNKINKQLPCDLHVKQHRLEDVFYPQNYQPFKSYPVGDINDYEPAFNLIFNSVRNIVIT